MYAQGSVSASVAEKPMDSMDSMALRLRATLRIVRIDNILFDRRHLFGNRRALARTWVHRVDVALDIRLPGALATSAAIPARRDHHRVVLLDHRRLILAATTRQQEQQQQQQEQQQQTYQAVDN